MDPSGTTAPGGGGGGGQAGTVVRVRRTGGIAGRTIEGSVDLSADDPRAAAARDLVDRLDLSGPTEGETFPDAFSYTFEVRGRS